MFFGLTNSQGKFQIMMNDILMFGGQTKDAIVVWDLDILCKHQLYLNAEKCMF